MSAGFLYTANRLKNAVSLWREFFIFFMLCLIILTKTSISLIIMSANCAGISGSQIFRTSDAPLYRRALTAVCVLAAVAWLQVFALCLQTWRAQVKERKRNTEKASELQQNVAVSTFPSDA